MRLLPHNLRKVGFALIGIGLSTFCLGQDLTIGIFGGKSSYVGEMQYEYFNPDESNLALGGSITANFSDRFGIKAEYIQSTISGSDANLVEPELVARNLHFKTSLQELSLIMELTLVKFGKNQNKPLARTYLFGGVGGLYFNPQASYNGEMVNLRPLGTEGQLLDPKVGTYEKTTLVYPFGIGFQINFTKRLSIGTELKLRYSQTDYLDDVSGQYPDVQLLKEQNPMAGDLSFRTPELVENYDHNPAGELRGDDKKFDQYFFFGGTVSYKILYTKKASKLPTFYKDPINR